MLVAWYPHPASQVVTPGYFIFSSLQTFGTSILEKLGLSNTSWELFISVILILPKGKDFLLRRTTKNLGDSSLRISHAYCHQRHKTPKILFSQKGDTRGSFACVVIAILPKRKDAYGERGNPRAVGHLPRHIARCLSGP